jgi:2,6-dihydroxypyridine 3-monooxygenase
MAQRTAGNRAAVVGGSIGGLTAALLLRDGGWEVDLFERSAVLLEGRGGGIVLHPATVRYLVERAGVAPAEISAAASWFRYLDGAGRIAHEQRCRYRFTSYNALYLRLLECFDRSRYHLAEECIGLEEADGRLCLVFGSGRLARADLVVFADGVNSIGRSLLAPGVEPGYAGYVAWRGTLDEERLGAGTFAGLGDAVTYHILPAGHFLTYPIPAHESPAGPDRLLNWLWYRNVRSGNDLDALLTGNDDTRFMTSVPPGLVPCERLAELTRHASASLPPVMAEIVQRTSEPFIQVIADVTVEHMAFGRACLIGDGAFTARPHVAAGTAKAAEDAWTLAAALGSGHGGAPLHSWSQRQVALGARTVARSREAGIRLQSGSWNVGEPLPWGLYRVGDSSFAGD